MTAMIMMYVYVAFYDYNVCYNDRSDQYVHVKDDRRACKVKLSA